MRLGKAGRSFSAYLPEAAYWALQADLKNGRLKFIEARFRKPRRGGGDLTSIYFSETPPAGTVNSIPQVSPGHIFADDLLYPVRFGLKAEYPRDRRL